MNNVIKKNILKQIALNVLILVVALVLFKGVSYSMENDTNMDNKDLLIATGNMQVVLSVPKNQYNFLGNSKYGLSDSEGKASSGYNFTVTNTGNIPIEYYEIRLVDEENKISTLPHSYIRFTISKDNEEYSEIKSLDDVDSIVYQGNDLAVGKSANFNIKMWIDDTKQNIFNKELYAGLEITLYQKYEVYNNYVLYASDGGVNIPFRTSIYSPISSTIPQKDGYKFLGWSTVLNGNVTYVSGDTYKETKGRTLYAVWEKILD